MHRKGTHVVVGVAPNAHWKGNRRQIVERRLPGLLRRVPVEALARGITPRPDLEAQREVTNALGRKYEVVR